MADCTGVSKTPTEILRPTRTYRHYTGKPLCSAGVAICPACGRPIATRIKADTTVMVRHSPKAQRFDERRRRSMTFSRQINSFVTAPPPIPYTGPVAQEVVVDQGSTGTGTYMGGYTRLSMNQTPITVTYTSNTVWTNPLPTVTTNGLGTYVIEVNGYRYASNSPTVRFMTDNVTWDRWNNQWTMSHNAVTVNYQVWQNWTGNVQAYTVADAQREVTRRGLTYARPVETPEERQARQQAEALALFQRVEAERLATQSAAERALGTLLGLLTAEQREEYATHGYFHVVGSKGRLYRILKGSSGNIRRVVSKEDKGKGEAAFCVHSVSRTPEQAAEELGLVPGHLPHEDHMIQQMLHLQIDEDEILAKANVHWGTREPTDAEIERFFAAQEASERENSLLGTLAPL